MGFWVEAGKFASNFFGDVRHYDCEGKPRAVYKKVDDAFPLYLREYDVQAKAAVKAAEQLSVDASAAVKSTVKELLVKIDKHNSSAQQHFRAAYAVYAAAPCEMLEFLQQSVSDIRANDAELRLIEMQLSHALQLVKPHIGAPSAGVDLEVIQIVKGLLKTPQERVLAEKIAEATKLAQDWKTDGH